MSNSHWDDSKGPRYDSKGPLLTAKIHVLHKIHFAKKKIFTFKLAKLRYCANNYLMKMNSEIL